MLIKFLRNYIINNRSKVLLNNKKDILSKSLFNNLDFKFYNFGKKNKNKIFYIIRRSPGGGMFSNLNFIIHHLYIAKKMNFIPFVDMENFFTLYNCQIKINNSKNAWSYYFKQVSKFKIADIYKSQNVIICDNKTKNIKYFDGFNNLNSEHLKIFRKDIKFNKKIQKFTNEYLVKNFLNRKILGIHFRGSDQKTQERHPLPATKDQMINAAKFLLSKYKFDKIFVSTEEKDYLDLFKKEFPDKILFINYRRSSKEDLFENKNKKNRYNIGLSNIIDMLLLSNVNYLLFVESNLPEASLFYSKNKIPFTKIFNGFNSKNIFVAQFLWYIKSKLPFFIGGFKKNIFK